MGLAWGGKSVIGLRERDWRGEEKSVIGLRERPLGGLIVIRSCDDW